ncbi:MAG TPA: glycoside hydrolase domain-containing protein [Acidobacteriaceae bacterium]|jgi:putative alpha-1,2-mannosidase|nr:glycoside hydrolase domain-containing protein [Acidobacteriaceae bacterium]
MNCVGGLALVGVLGINMAGAAAQTSKQPVDYVDPNIGGIGQLLTATVPYVQYPYGMARVFPMTTPGITDRYLADKIYGFPAGPALLMASDGAEGTKPEEYASDFDHDFETATPYYYEADLQTSKIKAEATTTREAICYRFTYPASRHSHLVLSLGNHAEFTVTGPAAVEGSEQVGGNVAKLANAQGETREYFYIEFSRPQDSWKSGQGGALGHEARISGDDIQFVTDMATHDGEAIEVRVGLSYISTDQARRNLQREIPHWGFAAVKEQARAEWNRALGSIATVGGSERRHILSE